MKLKDSRILACLIALVALSYFALSQFGGGINHDVARQQKPQAPARKEMRRAIVISLDGLDVRYLRKADEYGLKIPTLRRLMRSGVVAGVESVYPSVTYPNHTAIVTGATPARHGIVNNSVFVPPTETTGRYYWFADQIKTDTLWEAARREGLKTGLVSWPVATGAGDWSVPEIWKAGTSPGDSFPVTLAEISKHARPAGLVEEIAARDPDIYKGVTRDEGDDMRTRWAEYVVREKRPELMLVHLFDLDHAEHNHGPFTPRAFAILEKLDGYVGRILAAAESAGTLSDTAIFIVSDHGFRSVSKSIHPAVILREAGLVSASAGDGAGGDDDADGMVVTDWRAYPYVSGGSCAIMLRDAGDVEAEAEARAALERFNARAGGNLFRIVSRDEARKLGAFPEAAFVLDAAAGYSFGGDVTGEPVRDSERGGTHGYLPHPEDYRATFIASGVDVIRRGDLGTIHMTEVGPAIADNIGLSLGDARGRTLKLR